MILKSEVLFDERMADSDVNHFVSAVLEEVQVFVKLPSDATLL